MSRKDYVAAVEHIVHAMRSIDDPTMHGVLIATFCDFFKQDNGAFDKDRFIAAIEKRLNK